MNQIILFAGTTEGRLLSEKLCRKGRRHIVCVATSYGGEVLRDDPCVTVRQGRMDEEKMREMFTELRPSFVVDATHPFAREATKTIKKACGSAGVPYLRLKRECGETPDGAQIFFFPSHEACAKAIADIPGRILLTTGSRDLGVYAAKEALKSRLYVRVLPSAESMEECRRNGIAGAQILAMQGPFTREMNRAVLDAWGIGCLVTKQSGAAGGFEEKIDAARDKGIPVCVIGREIEEEGDTFCEICTKLGLKNEGKNAGEPEIEIYLVGMGPGSHQMLSVQGEQILQKADWIFGAPRLLDDGFCQTLRAKKEPYYRAGDILPILQKAVRGAAEEGSERPIRAAVLFSGDSGCFSGCRQCREELLRAREEGQWSGRLYVLPGISAVSCLAARLGTPQDGAAVISLHGRGGEAQWRQEVLCHVSSAEKTFFLTSGAAQVHALARLAKTEPQWELYAGRSLSYPDEWVGKVTEETELEDGLYTCLLLNRAPRAAKILPYHRDDEFCRGTSPMTKEEIRILALAKLQLTENAVCYDVGSGTGSVAAEMASLSPSCRVYAIEKKPEALELIKKNKERFGLDNLAVVEGEAPENLAGLPAPSHVFIGGSGGRLEDILACLLEMKKPMRIVIAAVTLETLQRLADLGRREDVKDVELVQLAVTQAEQAGDVRLLKARNPVWLCSFWRKGEQET